MNKIIDIFENGVKIKNIFYPIKKSFEGIEGERRIPWGVKSRAGTIGRERRISWAIEKRVGKVENEWGDEV